MKQIIRYAIVLIVLVSIIFLARNAALGAGIPSGDEARAAWSGVELAGDPAKDKPGTVKPPPGSILITESGTYSVGGFCNYTVQFLDPDADITVRVALERPLPRPLPDGVHKTRQGCRVTYFQNDDRIGEFTDQMGTSKICFAPVPGQEMTIHYYNVYDANPVWRPVAETTIENGLVCSPADPSAVYVATFETP